MTINRVNYIVEYRPSAFHRGLFDKSRRIFAGRVVPSRARNLSPERTLANLEIRKVRQLTKIVKSRTWDVPFKFQRVKPSTTEPLGLMSHALR